MKSVNKITPFQLFVLIVFANLILFLAFALLKGARAWDWLLMENIDLKFCDFGMHVAFSARGRELYYSVSPIAGCFPPLSYVMYWFFYRMLRRGEALPTLTTITEMDYYYLAVLFYTLIVILLLLFGIMMFGANKKKSGVLFMVLLVSVPFMAGGIFSGNSAVLTMAMLLIALKLREDESAWKREVALVLLAVCVGFKLYPAVFGLLYLTEKRWKEAVRLIVYSMILFFVPFAFFGGVYGFKGWLLNIRATMGINEYGRVQCIRGLIYTVATKFGLGIGEGVLRFMPVAFMLLMILLACRTRDKFRRIFFITAIMIFFPTNAYRYTLCYLAVPMIFRFLESDTTGESGRGGTAWAYGEDVCSALVFAIPVLPGLITRFAMTFPYYTLTYVELFVYIRAYLLLVVVTVHEIRDGRRIVVNRSPHISQR